MPYIKPKDREPLDPFIDQLAQKIAQQAQIQGDDNAIAGLLNYSCTRLALKVVQIHLGGMRYWIIALLTGTFHNIADEFYRRVGIPYENEQIANHGDVDLYHHYDKELRNRKT